MNRNITLSIYSNFYTSSDLADRILKILRLNVSGE
jgi:hypothetical protein